MVEGDISHGESGGMMLHKKVIRLLANYHRKIVTRWIPFVLSITVYAFLLWSLYIPIVFFVDSKGEMTAVFLSRELMISGFGILFTLPATIVLFYLESHIGLTKYRITLGILWVLTIAMAWWTVTHFALSLAGLMKTVPMDGLLAQSWVSIPVLGVFFYMTYVIRNYVTSKVETRRRRAFELHPKALSASDQLDVFEIIASLDELKRVYGESRYEGDNLLESLKHEICLSLDPRYNFPMPLPVALRFLHREIQLRSKAKTPSVIIENRPKDSFPAEFVIEPAVLCAVGAFIAEYGLYHGMKDLALHISFQESPMPCVEIRTNMKGGDLWFILDDQSSAQKAKNRLVETLNRFASKGSTFESTQDSHGCLLFRVSVQPDCATDATWGNVERTLGRDTRLLAHCDWSEGSNRVYENSNLIHKIQLVGRPSLKALTLAEEYNILRRLEDVEGVPHSPDYREYANFVVLSYTKVHGTPIHEYLAQRSFERRVWFHCIVELSALMNGIHKRGILHRDLRPDNILIREDGRVCLIDFDQAVAGAYEGRQVDTKGKSYGVIPPCVSIPRLIDRLDLRYEYMMVARELRSAWKIGARSNASSPGRNTAYYRWTFGDVELPGERDWFSRWDIIYKALRQFLPGAHILDLGCNMGLLASHCMLYGAEHVTAVDMHDDILEAGNKLAGAAGVSIDFLKGDLNSHDFIDFLLGRQYDLVIALSVVHWLKNPDEALRLLAIAPMVLFEGHNPPLFEINLLRGLGFEEVKLIGYSERLRGLYLACGKV
jgi:2-polyprenyl-3-methyl-5-hydroxy-6-metoxy-1,4-benzoquinol methylase/predicted Ser/Thr protein kinase